MSETRPLHVRLKDGENRECNLVIAGSPPWKILLTGVDLRPMEFKGDDLFKALCSLREALEKVGAQALCAGARPDVFPSGMARGMGGGRKAYITQIGFPALRTDLVDIFDYAPPEAVGSVIEQKVFHEEWADFFRR